MQCLITSFRRFSPLSDCVLILQSLLQVKLYSTLQRMEIWEMGRFIPSQRPFTLADSSMFSSMWEIMVM